MKDCTLVTGGNGLLGYALKQISNDFVFVGSADYDLTDICNVKALFEKYRPRYVLHLAAKVGGVKSNAERNADFYTTNIQINTNVLNIAQKYGVERLISVLSSCAFYINPDCSSSKESDLHEGVPFKGNLGYAYSKRMLDIHSKLLFSQYGSKFSTIAPATMFGPNDNWDLDDGHVIGALIHKCFLAKEKKSSLNVWGAGNAIRQFVFSYDVAHILLDNLTKYHGPETVIVSPDNGLAIKELVKLIVEVMDFKGDVIFDKTKPEGQLVKVFESNKFSDFFPGFNFTNLKDGLKVTVDWFLENYAINSGGV